MLLRPEADSAAGKKRILIVTRNLPPLVGGMERLNWHMADELSRYADVHVVGPADAEATKPANVGFSPVPLRPLWRFLLQAAWQTLRQASRWKPDVILAGSGLTAPIALIAARLCGTKALAYVHGLDISVSHPMYRYLWLPAIRRLDRVIANSNPTRELALVAGVKAERIGIVFPGVSLPAEPQQPSSFREKHQLGSGPLLLSVGRLTTRKGLLEFVRYVLPTIATKHPDVILAVVGDTPIDALHATAQSKESLQAEADALGVGTNIRFVGQITDAIPLSDAYRSSTVHIFPIRKIAGDPEGFGMVAIEAAAHGLPTVAFANGGVVDAVAEGKSGSLVAIDDYPTFAKKTLELIAQAPAYRNSSAEFAVDFCWENFGKGVGRNINSALAQ